MCFSNLRAFLTFFPPKLLPDRPEAESVSDVVDAPDAVAVVDGVRSGHSSEGIAALNLGGVDVAVSVVVVSELILEVIVIFLKF